MTKKSKMQSIDGTVLIIIIATMTHNFIHQVYGEDCKLPLSKQNHDKQPLYFTKEGQTYNLAKPKLIDGEIFITKEETEYLIIACPVKSILKTETRVEEIFTAQCHKGEWKIIRNWFQNENIDITDYKCDEKINFLLKEIPKKNCGHRTQIFEVGFKVVFNSKKLFGISKIGDVFKTKLSTDWHKVYTICFNTFSKDVLYTVHTIHGISIDARQKGTIEDSKLQYYSEYKLPTGEKINPETSYELKLMQETLIEDTSLIRYFDYETKNLIPKMLVPNSDMLFFNWKPASYFYANTTPLWRGIKNVWQNLEEQIRKSAASLKRDLTIYTGVHEEFILCHAPITLAEYRKAITVPVYFWKIVYDERTLTAIAFVIDNDPHNRNIKPLCTPLERHDSAKPSKLMNSNRYLGRTYSCTVQNLRENITKYQLPEFNVIGELNLPVN